MAVENDVTVAIILFIIALGAVAFLETRFLQKKMKNRRIRTAKHDEQVPEDAHNAIVTTKAILGSMERQGIRSEEASAWLREAEMAYSRHNYRVTMDLTGKAKDRLLALKSAQTSRGDLAKLEQLVPAGGSEEITTKELLQKEFPPNMLQSKFSIDLAGTAIEQGRAAGRDAAQASELLEVARTRFDAKDYTAALAIARQSKRSADGEKVEMSSVPELAAPAPITTPRPCPSCGAWLQEDDAFCRKCGTRLVPSACASCGTPLLADDVYCRKCGARVPGGARTASG